MKIRIDLLNKKDLARLWKEGVSREKAINDRIIFRQLGGILPLNRNGSQIIGFRCASSEQSTQKD